MSDTTSNNGNSFLGDLYNDTTNGFKNATNAVSDFTKNVYNKAKNTVTSSSSPSTLGGRRRRGSKKRYYGGKFHANTPLNGIASNASPISGIQHTAKAHYVGGKMRRRRKSRRHRHTRHCKH